MAYEDGAISGGAPAQSGIGGLVIGAGPLGDEGEGVPLNVWSTGGKGTGYLVC